ncbi:MULTISPECIES: sarcosine oxidase subunit gamma [unclassified Yoonia]|uniref:sarcosine oxidase subunit gamma n=1 Tax=unclassified Yoonia TaxID=2629118 RepID=UPI002AFFAFA3|nr:MULTISPECIES: sarcosine oxidase subunit gamma [unclassified Yoonia]
MARLIALGPFADLLPVQIGSVTCTDVTRDVLWSVAPYRGQQDAVSTQMQAQIGVGLPDVNRRSIVGDVMCQWIAHDQWLVTAPVALDGLAAVTDQSDGWAELEIAGDQVAAVLARLVPLDLRTHVFAVNHTARSLLGQMPVSITRTGAQAFEIMVMRSMAASLVDALTSAMSGVAARDAP